MEPKPEAEGAARPGKTALQAPGAVLLVSCYDLGRRPVAVATALEALVRQGFSPAVRDLSVEELDDQALQAARLVLVAVPMHTALRLGVRVAERARAQSPGVHVALFGLYAALNREHLLGRHCDSVVGGESDGPLCALAQALARELEAAPRAAPASLPREQVPQVSTAAWPAAWPMRKLARPPQPLLELAGTHLPGLRDLERYARLEIGGESRLVATVEASRGCLHLCRHCPVVPVYRGRFIAVPREEVLTSLAGQVALGARHVTFGDPDFFNGPTHALRLVEGLHRRWPELTFDATIKIEHLLTHAALLPGLAAAGCLFITTAVESLSDRVLTALDKGHTAADVPRALALTRAAGLDLRPTLLPYTPWTALEDLPALFDFAEEQGLVDQIEPVQYTLRLLLPPGSALLEPVAGPAASKSEGAVVEDPSAAPARRPSWLGPFDAERFTWSWRHPDPRVDALAAASAALAEAHSLEGRPPRETFAALRALADLACGRAPRTIEPLPPQPGHGVPRLSEPWFC
jgi:radical SAM superfamily enzyme YgiQ (UPF0313 family)